MSKLEKSIGDLSNEEIVNTLLEDFQKDISLNANESSGEKRDTLPTQQGPKIIELDEEHKEQHECGAGKNSELNISDDKEAKENSQERISDDKCDEEFGEDKSHNEVELEEERSENQEEEDVISEDEGIEDKDFNEEEIENLEKTALELKNEGNELFKQNLWPESLAKYNEALRSCPKSCRQSRAIFYANRAAVYEKMDKIDLSIKNCTKSLVLNENYLKVYQRRARLYQQSDKLDEALADYEKILKLDPRNHEAYVATQMLPKQINERNEKLKEEMLGKLKDLGNMILRPFGLSTNNFQMVQDPNSGGYSINFQQGAGTAPRS